MPDNLKIKEPRDRQEINIHEPWEVNWWCKELGCTKKELEDAVKKVGPMVKNVKKELNK